MAESATSTRYSSIKPELCHEIPNQFTGNRELEAVSDMYQTELSFSLLCNVSLFGAPLFKSLLTAECVDEYVKSRLVMIEWLKAIRLDLKSPIIAFKAERLKRLRKSIDSLNEKDAPAKILSWYFQVLLEEAKVSIAQQQADFNRVKTFKEYDSNTGQRLRTFDVETFSNASTHSLKGKYWKELTKLSDSIRRKSSNKTLLFALLGDSPHLVFTDAAISTDVVTMTVLILEDEQSFIADNLGIRDRFELHTEVDKDTRLLAQKMSPSRYRPDTSAGYRSYRVEPHLSELDWIDTEVSDISIYSHLNGSLIEELQSQPNATDSDSDSTSDERDQQVFTPEKVRRETMSTMTSSPPPIPRLKSPEPNKRWNPEPMDTSRLGTRERERTHLLEREKRATQPERSTLSPPADISTNTPPRTSLDEGSIEPSAYATPRELTYLISDDSCQHALDYMELNFRDSSITGDSPYGKALSLQLHATRFPESQTIATQMDASQVRITDNVMHLCTSGDSIRYVVTYSPDLNAVLFNRVHYYRWIRWS
nr:hypothetical protein [Colletotrichum associated partitivirus 2]